MRTAIILSAMLVAFALMGHESSVYFIKNFEAIKSAAMLLLFFDFFELFVLPFIKIYLTSERSKPSIPPKVNL